MSSYQDGAQTSKPLDSLISERAPRIGTDGPPEEAEEKITSKWRSESLSDQENEKVMKILEACRSEDLYALANLATSEGGLVEDEMRRIAWPVLLGCRRDQQQEEVPWSALPVHRDEDQVKLDVNRSFVYYPQHQTEKQLEKRKQELSNLITEVLRRHPMLCYFQGYHDIAQVFLLVLGSDLAAPAIARLSLLRIRDFMLPTLSPAVAHLYLLPSILECADPALRLHLAQTSPYFALAATLTLYAHDVEEYGEIARLFDFLLAHETVVSIYLFAIIIVERKEELLDVESDEPDMLHFILSKLPKPLHLEGLIVKTMNLYNQYPPPKLPFRAWRQISSYSVLKTTRDREQLSKQTLRDGERGFRRQALQMKMMQTQKRINLLLRKHRRQVAIVGVAVVIGVLSWWLGRSERISARSGYQSMLSETVRRIVNILRK